MTTSKIRSRPYLSPMLSAFDFCLPTAAKMVPGRTRPEVRNGSIWYSILSWRALL